MRSNNSKTSAATVAILLGIGASTLSLHAYNLIEPVTYWPVGNVEWQVKLAGNGANIPIPSEGSPLQNGNTSWGDAFQLAVDSWNNAIPPWVLTLSIVKNSAINPGQGDGVNNVGFSDTVYGNAWGGSTAGISLSIWTGTKRIENDVLFNATKTWDAYEGDLQGNTVEFVRVAMHELGHSLGLDHPDDDGQVVDAIMNSVSSDLYQLQDDDITGIYQLYGDVFPVIITQDPSSYTTPVGGTWQLSVVVTGSEPITYAWELSTDDGNNWSPVDGLPADASSFSYPNIQMSQNGWRVRVGVTNPASFAQSDSAILTVTATAQGPGFSSHPFDESADYGDNVFLNVDATGSPSPDIQWEYSANGGTTWLDVVDGQFGSIATSATGAMTNALELTYVTDALDGWLFRARAANSEGSATSTTATLTVADAIPVSFLEQPLSANRTAGALASFYVSVQGTAPITYQWQKDGVDIPGENESFIEINNVQASHAGNYRVVVTNPAGSIESNVAVLSVDTPLAINEQPVETFAVVGSNAAITVVAQGNGTLSYQWKKDGVDVSGATSATLMLNAVTLADAADYTVVVSNLDGNVTSAAAALIIFEPIPIENRRIAASDEFTLFVEADGTLSGAGTNASGGMGSGNGTRYFSPITLGTGVAGVYSRLNSGLRIHTDGTLWGAGGNDDGQLGIEPWGPGVIQPTWAQISSNVATAATGYTSSFFLRQDGTLWTMGFNSYGLMGLPDVTQSTTPVQVRTGVRAIAGGGTHAGFIDVLGDLWMMGLNQDGQLGVDSGGNDFVFTPVFVMAGVKAISLGVSHTLILTEDGKLWAAGANVSGQLGDGTNDNRVTPVLVTQDVVSISAGWYHSLFIRTDGTLWGVGRNEYGQLGTGDILSRNVPVMIDSGVEEVAGSWGHTIYLKTNGELWGTGRNTNAQFGDGTLVDKNMPVEIFSGTPTPQEPFITSQPVSQNANPGDLVQFTVTASGDAPLAYQWRKDGVAIPGATGLFYQIASVQASDAGTYTVVVTNGVGSATSSGAVLTINEVLVAPSITSHPSSVTVLVGDVVSFTVAASGTPPLSYQWKKDGADIPGATSATLNIASAQLGDAGSYTAVVTNAQGSATSNGATLTVNIPPAITTHPTPQTVTVGAAVSFTVAATGTAPLSYQWRKGGVNISGATSTTYNIAATVTGDAGSYTCVVTNVAGSATTNVATLTVNVPPSITSHPASKTAVIGSDATFSVTATGTAPLSYQWKRNGANVSGGTESTLVVTDVQPGAGATYTVVVTNVAGSVTSNPATLALDTTPRLINVSCLASAGVGDSTLVAGFFIKGSGSKTLLIRGIGPRLTSDPFNRTGVVADPQISVYDKDGVLIASNDNWDPILAADFSRMGAFGLTNGSLDAALKVTLPGNDRYTVHLVNNGPIADGLIEVYDFSRDLPTRLSNVSCRIAMKAGETVILGTSLIANPVPVLASAVGPGLANYGIPIADVLPDPDVRVYAGSTEIAFNEDWNSSLEPYFGPAGAFPLTAGSKDAVARVTFSQGGLTIHATGKGQSGVAIIQLFESPDPP